MTESTEPELTENEKSEIRGYNRLVAWMKNKQSWGGTDGPGPSVAWQVWGYIEYDEETP